MERFLALKQGGMSVKEYVNKSNQLARFGLELVNTLHKKDFRFARGLNEPLHGLAMSYIPMGATFKKLIDMALMHEEDKGEKKEAKINETQKRMCGLRKNNNIKRRAERMTKLETRGNVIIVDMWVI